MAAARNAKVPRIQTIDPITSGQYANINAKLLHPSITGTAYSSGRNSNVVRPGKHIPQ